MHVSESEAREAALALWSGWHRHSTITAGLAVNREAIKTAIAAAEDLTVLQYDGRRSPEGRPMDFLAPSSWHAASSMLAAGIGSRTSRVPFSDDAAFDQFFGHRAIFRGQARAWRIQPTGWRHQSFNAGRALRAVKEYVGAFSTDDDAVEFELFGRLRSDVDAAALAQHYGVPTNLVDFTFDPLAAVYFALGDTLTPALDLDGPRDHAVIFTAPVHKFAAIGGIHFSFPPVQLHRLFRQSGLFIDFGNRPETVSERGYDDPWTWFEQNSARIFFPRVYPGDNAQAAFARDYYLAADPFLEEVVLAAKAYAEGRDDADCIGFMRQRVKTRPPWRLGDDGGGIYTDDEFLAIGRLIERYLVTAALVHTGDGPCYDPVILGLIANTDDRVLRAITELAEMRGTSLSALAPTAEQIRRSLLRLRVLGLDRTSAHSHERPNER